MNNLDNFAVEQIADVSARITAGTTTTVLGIPSAGITLFIKHLAEQPLGKVILVDVFSLARLTSLGLFTSLAHKLGEDGDFTDAEEAVLVCKKRLQELAQHEERVVICIAGFDLLEDDFSDDLFRYLRSLRLIDRSKIVYVFGVCKRLETLIPPSVTNIDLSLFSSVYYLQPYDSDDLDCLLAHYGPETELEPAEKRYVMQQSGGHFRFLQLLIGSEKKNNPVQDPFIQIAFKNVYNHLSATQKSILRKVATDGTYTKTDDYLTNIGLIRRSGAGDWELFSPLFRDCILALTAGRLPIKERRLLAILKKHEGKIVSKHDLYDAVWLGQEIGSEWALNALIYRLRKHPAFIAKNYTIENHKKMGYMLVKSS